MMKKYTALVLSVILLLVSVSPVSFAGETDDADVITMLVLGSSYNGVLSLPQDAVSSYTIPLPGPPEEYNFTVFGKSVSVKGGVVTPFSEQVTSIGLMDGSVTTTMQYSCGRTVVVVSSPKTAYCKTYTFDVKDYSDVVMEQKIDEFVQNNITEGLTVEEKLDRIGAFIASFDYNYKYQSLKSMLLFGEGGDCWASTDAAVILCERLGIPARAHSDDSVSIFSGGHMYAVACADGQYYAIEAGFDGKAPRQYSVTAIPYPYVLASAGPNELQLMRYYGFDRDVVIPATVNGYPVTSISHQCFSLANRYIDGGIRSITLPDTITELGPSCCYGCSELERINIPASVSVIGMGALNDCPKLQVEVSPDNPNFTAEDGILYTKDKKEVVCAYAPQSDCVIPEGVERIGDCAFYNGKLNSISLPDTLKEIRYGAFQYCTFRQGSLVLPESVEGVGYGALYTDGVKELTILNKNCVINNTTENQLNEQEDGNTISAKTICGFLGSTAEAYAEKYQRTFAQPCAAVLQNGAHQLSPHTCAEKEVGCSVCGTVFANDKPHDYQFVDYSYDAYQKTACRQTKCAVCGNRQFASIGLQDVPVGDVDLDGAVTAADARLALRASVGLERLNGFQMYQCNVDADAAVSAADARLILRCSVGLESFSPREAF